MCLTSDSKHLTNVLLNPFSQLALNPAGAHLANITLSISTSQKVRVLGRTVNIFPITKTVFLGVC